MLMLRLINTSWQANKLPKMWKSSIVIPIPKPDKDPTDCKSYRPISLTSNLCKVMETMVKNRLEYHIESNSLLNKTQSGFRRNRSTTDHIVRLQHAIKKGMARREYTLGIFLDIEKAFDLVWQDGIILKLDNMGIKGRIQHWIRNFLSDRQFKVRIENTFSSDHQLDNGTPQGSVISPTLFNILINGLAEEISLKHPAISQSLFADDAAIWKTGRSIKKLTNDIQKTLNTINSWANKWGFKFSACKTTGILFSNKLHVKIQLKLDKREIEFKKSVRYLGVILDSKLTWKAHIDQLIIRCNKDLNLMRCVSGTNWGANKTSLLRLYQCLIRSKIDYGSAGFMTACKTQLKRIDSIQYAALKIATRAFKGTPLSSLQIETNEKPLNLRREELSMKYANKALIKRNNHPCHSILEPKSEYEYLKHKWHKNSAPFGYKINLLFREHQIPIIEASDTGKPVTPAWQLQKPSVDIKIHHIVSKKDNPVHIRANTLEYIDQHYREHLKLYTDGSKNEQNNTGSAYVIPELKIRKGFKLPDNMSVYSSELVAIIKALEWILEHKPIRTVILSDSLSSLQSIEHSLSDSRPDLIHEIEHLFTQICYVGSEVTLCWVPAHVNIRGNEAADKAAKDSLNKCKTDVKMGLGVNEINSIITDKVNKKWQNEWDKDCNGRWLYSILGGNKSNTPPVQLINKRDDTIITRLRLGKTGLKSHIATLLQNTSPICTGCNQEDETIDHIFTKCSKIKNERHILKNKLKEQYIPLTLSAILNPKVHHRNYVYQLIIDYLKSTGYYNQI